mgnify:CR=1 FL=1
MENLPESRCCEGYGIDMVHSAECSSTDGRYRCEECDQPFMRRTSELKRCEFCRRLK